jgi:hypothetical protein
MKTRYIARFNLTNPIDDDAIEAANEYLQSDDMTQFIDNDLKPIINSIKWNLDAVDSGGIIVLANRELTRDESSRLSDWISGQCSDGLGEGFDSSHSPSMNPRMTVMMLTVMITGTTMTTPRHHLTGRRMITVSAHQYSRGSNCIN